MLGHVSLLHRIDTFHVAILLALNLPEPICATVIHPFIAQVSAVPRVFHAADKPSSSLCKKWGLLEGIRVKQATMSA